MGNANTINIFGKLYFNKKNKNISIKVINMN